VQALKKVTPLHGLEEAEYEWLATRGTEVFAESALSCSAKVNLPPR